MHKSRRLAWILIGTILISGCATVQQGEKGDETSPEACIAAHTIGGAVIGGIVGAATGAAVKGKKGVGKGAAIGAGAGAIAGFAYAWGKCFTKFSSVKSQQIKDYDETSKQVGYSPGQGLITRINEYSLDPSTVSPGTTVNFNANYYVMTPSEQKEVTVTETRILKRYDEQKKQFVELGSVPETIKVVPGLRRAEGKFDVPEKVEEGKYMIGFMVNVEDKADLSEMPLIITRDRQVLAKAEKDKLRSKIKEEPGTAPPQVAKAEETGDVPAKVASLPEEGAKAVAPPVKEKYILITVEKVNLRENPDTTAKIISTASRNEKYPLVSSKDVNGRKWHLIRLDDGKTLWLIGSAAKIIEE